MSQEVEAVGVLSPGRTGVQLPDITTPDIAAEFLEDWSNIADGPDQFAPEPSPEQFVDAAPPPREIVFDGVLHVNGYAAGLIRSSNGHLVVDADGTVDADIWVSQATIYGCVRGDIRAKEKVELGSSARVIGDIETVALSIAPGAVFEGRCIFLQASEPSATGESSMAATG